MRRLFYPGCRERLIELYSNQELPIRQVAEILEECPSAVRRALEHYGIHIRTKSEAQALALRMGRANNPKCTENILRENHEHAKDFANPDDDRR